MAHEIFNLDELAKHLGQDRNKLEKLVNRGRIPGRKVGGEWQFHQTEITLWLEQEMREYSIPDLIKMEQSHPPQEIDSQRPVSSLLHPETVEVPLEARTKRSVLESLVETAGHTWKLWEPNAILKAVQDREEVMSTGFENGVAIPHPRNPLPDVQEESIIAYGRTQSGIVFGGPKGVLTDIFFLVLCRDSSTHLHVLARLGRMLQQTEFLDQLRSAPDSRSSYELICQLDAELSEE